MSGALRAVVLIDHGSRRAEANLALEDVAARARRLAGEGLFVATAHMELAAPTLEDALAACALAGAREVVVVPYFLASGRHVTEDIPRMAREAAEAHPALEVRVSAPLGPDDALARLALARAAEASLKA